MGKKSIVPILAAALSVTLSCSTENSSDPLFTPLVYVASAPDYNPDTQYLNPIIPGFWPDPSICRVGEDYYMVNSTFQYFPGIPVWHSTDLVHWERKGYVLDSDDKVQFWNELMEFGIFAPHISYNPGNGKYYVICTQINGPLGCFFCVSDDPSSGVWSDPVRLPEVPGIDPSLFFDDDGRAYIVSAANPGDVGGKAGYFDDNAIIMWNFDCGNGRTFGKPRIIMQSGVHPERQPVALEGPHIYKVGGKYFLMCAEGGTDLSHSEVVFESERVDTLWRPCGINPILTQRDLPADRPCPVSCTGHADLVSTPGGQWYAVFLGTRPYFRDDTFNTGRETFLLPVSWKDGQPVILDAGVAIDTVVEKDPELLALGSRNRIKGFNGYDPGPLWSSTGLSDFAATVRGSLNGRMAFKRDGRLRLECSGVSLDSLSSPSMVLERISAHIFSAETVMQFAPAPGKEAGLICWHDDDHYMKLVKTIDAEGNTVLRLEERGAEPRESLHSLLWGRMHGETIYSTDIPLEGKEADSPLLLRVEATDPCTYVFSYAAVSGKASSVDMKPVGEPRDARHLSTLNCGGFQGAMVGVYAY